MRVGVVGCGLIGRHRAQVVKQFDGTELAIVADVNRARASALAQELGCEATTEWEGVVARKDVDVVIVCTTPDFHALISVAAAQNGKHVLCEKPLGRNPEEARLILDAARKNGVKLKTGFNHRHYHNVQKARELVDQGVIGELYLIRCRYGHGGRPSYDKEWRADPEIAGGGELLDQGVHAIDLFRWFLGDFSEAFGFTATYVWGQEDKETERQGEGERGRIGESAHGELSATSYQLSAIGHRLEDNVFALFRTYKGQIASLHASWTQWKNLFSFEMFGQDGYILVEGLGGSYGSERLILGKRSPESGPPDEERLNFPSSDESWHNEWAEFVAAIREDREPLGNGYDGWQAMRMVYAVYESARTGQVVRLEDREWKVESGRGMSG